jgi:hypothetical protein
MKVRHKINGRVREVEPYLYPGDYKWFEARDDGTTLLFSENHWEPVPSETWRDVTGECEYLAEGPDHLLGLWHGRTIVCPPAYRARKVQASRALDDDDLRIGEEEVCWHFIIEKREP